MDDPLSCQTSEGYKPAKNEKAKNISLQQLQGNSHPAKKNKVVVKKKPPPLMDFDSAKDDTTATHTAMQLTSYAGGSNNQTVIHHQNGGEENVLDDDEEPQNHNEKDYWDVLDEDKNLSVRLSEKRIMTREYYSCMETLAQEEEQAGPKTSIIEANSRQAAQKVGEEETEPEEEEYEDDYFEISQSKDIMSSQKFNSRPSVTEHAANARFIKGKPESVSSRFEDSNLLTERLNQILVEERKGPLPLVIENKPVVPAVMKAEENNKPRTSYHSFENSPMPQIKPEGQNKRVLATPPTIEKEDNMMRREDKSAAKNHSIGCLDTTSVYAENTLRGGPESIKGNTQLIQLKSASKLAKQQDYDYEPRDHSPLKYSDLAEIKEEKSNNSYNYNYQDHHLYKSIEIKQQHPPIPTISPLKARGVNVMSDNDLVNRMLENRSISVTGLNQGKTRENWSKEIHNQLDTIRENIWQKRQIEKIVQQAQQNSQNSYREGSGNSFRAAAKSVEKFASSLGENDPNYIIAQRKGIERASRLIQSREKSDLSYHSRSRRSVNNSEVDISGSSMDKSFSKRYENIVKDDVKKLMEKALNPKSKRLDVYLHQERERRHGLSGREAQGKSDWKGLLQKKSDYSHPFAQNNSRAYSPERGKTLIFQ